MAKQRQNLPPDQLHAMRHSLAHIMAAAIQKLWPEAKFGVGPVIDDGFYYDVDFGKHVLTPEDLPKIEAEMGKIIKANLPFEQFDMKIDEAIKWAREHNQEYKAELLADLKQKGTTAVKDVDDPSLADDKVVKLTTVSFYRTGEFEDLCRGPHVKSTGQVGAYKLHKIAGAYWRGSEKNPMLTRVYGVAFADTEAVGHHFAMLAEAEKRDHKKLGRELELFFFHETAPGMAYWLPKGTVLLNQLLKYWRRAYNDAGYHEIMSPMLNKKTLYDVSGHWQHYLENMFVVETADKEVYGLKPMNCPNAMVVYKSASRSYRDLPLRLSDSDPIHRYEPSGTVNGLLRARAFRQDDAHLFVREDQIVSEYAKIFELIEQFYGLFGLEYSLRLGTRPDNFMGDAKTWDKAEAALKGILEKSGRQYHIEEGDGAFYGPKIDILMKDALARDWQMGTVQLDFQIPRNFELVYTDETGKEQTPAVIHHVIYGSLDRFLGILLEHNEGRFPVWLAPEQVRIITVNDKPAVVKYAQEVLEKVKLAGLRSEADLSNETVGKKIRQAELMKVPYTLVIGDNEIKSGKLVPRLRKDIAVKHADQHVGLEQFIKTVVNEATSHVHTSSL
ncbi:threonine--tRNA ligase [Candidatus Microgenomates bacterium]|nr:threonine--tRNA ligase [Candidatus Microgenomates bacterium]